jgi:hypothetical protein
MLVLDPPLDHPLNLTTQLVLTVGSYVIALALLALAFVKGWRQRTPFHLLLVLSAGLAAFAEPLYDQAFKLLFFIPGQWTLYTYADIPQPVWTVSGYIALYAGPALFICDRSRPIDVSTFWRLAGITWLASSIFETVGIQGGAYAYWGPHVLRVLGYPLVVGVLETTFVMLFSVCASELRKRAANTWSLCALLIAFPGVFYFVNFGIGAPTLVTLGLSSVSPSAVYIGSTASILLALALLTALSRYYLPSSTLPARLQP